MRPCFPLHKEVAVLEVSFKWKVAGLWRIATEWIRIIICCTRHRDGQNTDLPTWSWLSVSRHKISRLLWMCVTVQSSDTLCCKRDAVSLCWYWASLRCIDSPNGKLFNFFYHNTLCYPTCDLKTIKMLGSLSSRENYTDRATAACHSS
jgi:hypothetical protein